MEGSKVSITDLRQIFTYVAIRNVALAKVFAARVVNRCEELKDVHSEEQRFSFMLSSDATLDASEQLRFECFTLGADGDRIETNTFWFVNFRQGQIIDPSTITPTLH